MSRVTFISRMTVKAGHEAEFVRLCSTLAERVHATESKERTLFYQFYKLREPRRYAVIESFASEADEHAHMTSKALAELGPGIVACLDGEYVREYLDPFAV
ncbi:MAG: antibiotic biosynthesis monooxygenase [Proteobacteria bacterium]|nr:antibiotic biosynthesis monooxygenase [Pseudomonadota bacterium]